MGRGREDLINHRRRVSKEVPKQEGITEPLSEHITREDAQRIMSDFRQRLIQRGDYPDFHNFMNRQEELVAYIYELAYRTGSNDSSNKTNL